MFLLKLDNSKIALVLGDREFDNTVPSGQYRCYGCLRVWLHP